MIQIFMAAWPAYLVLLLLGLSTVSTKAAGAFWLSLIVLGIYDWLKKSRQNLLPCANPPQDTLNNIAKGWLIFCLVALAIKTIPMVYGLARGKSATQNSDCLEGPSAVTCC